MLQFDLSLRVTHPTINPSLVTRTLRLQPHTQWTAGTERFGKDGRKLPGKHEGSYWAHRTSHTRRETLEEAIGHILTSLQGSKNFLRRISKTGGRTELFVGIYVNAAGGVFFPCELLQLAADAKIDLSLDIYSK